MSEFIERLSVEDARSRETWDLDTLAFLKRHFELILVSTLLIVVAAVVNWVPDKLAFLHFIYLPVLAAGYLLGARRAILTAVLCVLLVFIFYLWSWAGNALAGASGVEGFLGIIGRDWRTLVSLTIWAVFWCSPGAHSVWSMTKSSSPATGFTT